MRSSCVRRRTFFVQSATTANERPDGPDAGLVLLLVQPGEPRLFGEVRLADVVSRAAIRGDVRRQLLDCERVARKLVVLDDPAVGVPVVLDRLQHGTAAAAALAGSATAAAASAVTMSPFRRRRV